MLPPLCLPLRLSLALVFAWCCAAPPSHGQEIVDDQDAQLWVQFNSQVPVSQRWTLVLEGQPRWNQNFTHYDQIVLRTGVNRRVSPWLQLGAAYAVVPRRTVVGAIVEHQAYQQAVVALPRLGGWTSQLRIREDQRFLRQWGDAAHRVREQIRVTHPLPRASAWTVVINEEAFYNLDRTLRGPAPGWDQLRAYAGLQHAVSRDVAVEVGYMWQEVFRLGLRPHRRNHNAMVQFQYRPRRDGSRATPESAPAPAMAAPAPATDVGDEPHGRG